MTAKYTVRFLNINTASDCCILNALNTIPNKFFIKKLLTDEYNLKVFEKIDLFNLLFTDLLIINPIGLDVFGDTLLIIEAAKLLPISIIILNASEIPNIRYSKYLCDSDNIIKIYNNINDLDMFSQELQLALSKNLKQKPRLTISDALVVYKNWLYAFGFNKNFKDSKLDSLLDTILVDKIEKNLVLYRGCCK